jgi:hypothetical protein
MAASVSSAEGLHVFGVKQFHKKSETCSRTVNKKDTQNSERIKNL